MKTWKNLSVAAAVLVIVVLGALPVGSTEDEKSITQMTTAAKTSVDHRAIAAFYQEESTRLQREAEQHADLAKQLVSEAGGQNPAAGHHYDLAEHCRKFADAVEKAAQEAQSLAKVHEGIAQSLQK